MDVKSVEEAIERVCEMERLFDKVSEAAYSAPEMLWKSDVQEAVKTLSDYVSSGMWLHDYELDEQRLFPLQLKRGVLSQDGLYNLLCDLTEMGIIGKNEI